MTTTRNQESSAFASITETAKVEKIVDYSFERNDKSNVLAIHPTRSLIAYLINIQRTQKISKAWSSGNDSIQSPSSSSINGQSSNLISDKNKTVSIRIIDYVTRQRCLAKGIYHARPADCVFAINSLTCSQSELIKLAIVDRLANVYLYDLSYFINDLTATRIAVIRSSPDASPYEHISLVWCPFVPCEDFDDGDGGLRLALATNSRIEIFAVDRLQGKTGELQRSELKGAYKCIQDAHRSDIVTLSISPDCSTISAAALDNRITFFSSDIVDSGQRCLHNWEASMIDSPISTLLFLDDYPKLLEDSTMQFWGAAFIGTRGGLLLLIDLKTWTVYQKLHLNPEANGPKNFEYRIDLTSKIIVAINSNQCYVIQIEHDYVRLPSIEAKSNQHETSLLDSSQNDIMNGNIFNYLLSKSAAAAPRPIRKSTPNKKQSSTSGGGLPKIVKTTRLSLHTPIYSFVIKYRSNGELELFTISAYSLELYIINLNVLEVKVRTPEPTLSLPQQQQSSVKNIEVKSSSTVPIKSKASAPCGTVALDINQMDRMVEALFTRLNSSFSHGLDEFLEEVRCEVNDLKSKLNGLSRDVSKLNQQLQDIRLNK